jgi:DnaK suppressor protein
MTAEALERLRAERRDAERLLAQLTVDLAGFVEASRDTNADDEHDPEGATIAFERAQVDALARRTRQRLADVDEAIARLEAGGYGVCERCGRPIDPERLAIRPSARTCVACAGLSRRRR